ncbi:MAG: DEAD/DEAH box helicase [Deltaproteobacteria bacterium]|nr:DEAD/DEAH box helicase [Deltaproteobacteria bacterium]
MTIDNAFPLYQRAAERGVLQGRSALIVAPTATGKSYVGREFARAAVQAGLPGTSVYLVPYRALAQETYDRFVAERAARGTSERIRIATGEHTDPVRPAETDILVATYERFASVQYTQGIRVASLVADEFHLVADETRGPFVEGLLARLKGAGRLDRFLGLSAVVGNGEQLAAWLGVDLVMGTDEDRRVPVRFECRVVPEVQDALGKLLKGAMKRGEQTLVFCRSRAGAEKQAEEAAAWAAELLVEEERPEAARLSYDVLKEDGDADRLAKALQCGVGFHHAGLGRGVKGAVETAFRDGAVRILACTPTLASGVNLPAGLVVVRDVYRQDFLRGRPRTVFLPSGEVLNMLGRAGRPGKVTEGRGVALVSEEHGDYAEVRELRAAVKRGVGEPVRSRMPDSFEPFLRFVLAAVRERGEATLDDVAAAVRQTLWYATQPAAISFGRPFEEDMMEDVPAYAKVQEAGGSIRLAQVGLTADGIEGRVGSGGHEYGFEIRIDGMTCECPAASRWHKGTVCKHLACAIHDLLFDPTLTERDADLHIRAVYLCAHLFGSTLDTGTKIAQAAKVLRHWGLLDDVPGGAFRASPAGEVAEEAAWDLLLVWQVADMAKGRRTAPCTGGHA